MYYLRWFSRHHWPIWVLTLRRFCKFQIIVDSFGLSVIYSLAIYWTHKGLSVIYSFVTDRTLLAFLSFTVLPYIGYFWLICHLQFSHILDTFGLSVIYSFVPDRTLLVYLSLQFSHKSDALSLPIIYRFCHRKDTFVPYSFRINVSVVINYLACLSILPPKNRICSVLIFIFKKCMTVLPFVFPNFPSFSGVRKRAATLLIVWCTADGGSHNG